LFSIRPPDVGCRGVEQFKLKTIKADRPLYRDPEFKPEWPWLPAVKERHAHRIVLDDRERVACLRRFAAIPNSAVSRTQRSFDSVSSAGTPNSTCGDQSS
jgi:hypothetical protein